MYGHLAKPGRFSVNGGKRAVKNNAAGDRVTTGTLVSAPSIVLSAGDGENTFLQRQGRPYQPVANSGFLRPEKIIGLAAVAENDHQGRSKHFRRCRIPAEIIHKKLQEQVVEDNADKDHQQIPHQLCPAFQPRFLENDITVKIEAGGQAETKGKGQRCNVRAYGQRPPYEILLPENKIIRDGKKRNIEDGVGAAGGCISERMQRDNSFKRLVKEIDER